MFNSSHTFCVPPPSGDPTGETDYKEIQRALDRDSLTTVIVNGKYVVNETIRVNDKVLMGVTLPQLTNTVRDEIKFTSATTLPDKPLLVGHHAAVANLMLNSSHRCRGIIMHRDANLLLDNVIIGYPIRVGLDLVECWGGSIRNVRIVHSRGIAMRTHRANAFTSQFLMISRPYLFRNTNPDENQVTWEYACEHGQQAAREQIAGYTEDWPDPDEELEDLKLTYGNAAYLQTPVEDRAAVVLGREGSPQNMMQFHMLGIEPCFAGEFPSISSSTQNLRIEGLRLEGGYHRRSVVLLHNRQPEVDARANTSTTIENVFMLAQRRPEYLVEVEQYSRDLKVSQVSAGSHIQKAVVAFSKGKHHRPEISHSEFTGAPEVSVALDGAVIVPMVGQAIGGV